MNKIRALLMGIAMFAIGEVAYATLYPLFGPSTGILKGSATSPQTSAAASSDVIALWSGSCSSSTFLRGDGACQSPGGGGTPGGSNTQIQYNNSGAFGGASNITYNNSSGQLTIGAPTGSSLALSVTGPTGGTQGAFLFASQYGAAGAVPDMMITRAGSTINSIGQGPNLTLQDTTNTKYSLLQQSGGQTELWQFNGSSWSQPWFVGTTGGFVTHGATGGDQGIGTVNSTAYFINGAAFAPPLTGTSSSIGGGALAAGACASTTVSITGATTSMVANAAPAGGTDPGVGNYWQAFVSSSNTVTVRICAAIAGTPTATTYNVRVEQ